MKRVQRTGMPVRGPRPAALSFGLSSPPVNRGEVNRSLSSVSSATFAGVNASPALPTRTLRDACFRALVTPGQGHHTAAAVTARTPPCGRGIAPPLYYAMERRPFKQDRRLRGGGDVCLKTFPNGNIPWAEIFPRGNIFHANIDKLPLHTM